MAEAVEGVWGPCDGLLITRDGYARELRGIEVVEAVHPVPDTRGFEVTGRMLELLASCGEGDFVRALISGGGSSLLTRPAGAITLAEEQALTRTLLASGAPIEAMNIVRKHLSVAKGGRLAAAAYQVETAVQKSATVAAG
jgi:glycerate 2-kinase